MKTKMETGLRNAVAIFLSIILCLVSFGNVLSEEGAGGTLSADTQQAQDQASHEPTAPPTPEPTAPPTPEPTAEPTPEPTATPTPEPTAEPSDPPTAEPTASVTPSATQVHTPAANETLPNTLEPTATPVPTSTPLAGNNLAEMPDIRTGYMRLLNRATAYLNATGREDGIGQIAKGAVAYAFQRPNVGSGTDRLRLAFNVNGVTILAYVDAEALYPLSDLEIRSMQEAFAALPATQQADYDDERTLPLPAAEFVPSELPTGAPPAADAAASAPAPEFTPTPEPTAEGSALPTEPPMDTFTIPDVFPATPTPAATATATPPAPVVTPSKEDKPGKGNLEEKLSGLSLADSANVYGSKVTYINVNSLSDFQSQHNYANNTDMAWVCTVPSAARVTITFSTDTYVENNYDFIVIYDAEGTYVAAFTGGQLAGKSITTRGNRVHVRLLSDNSVTHYGFRVTAVAAYLQPTLTQCYATGATRGVRLSWNGTSLIDGYYIYRATTTRSGSTGAFTYLAKVSGSQSSFVDQAAVPGVINSYKMLAYNRVSGVEYRSGMSNVLNMSPLGKAVIASVTSDGSGSVQIRWNAVSNATGYALYGATQANGTYTQLGTVTNGVNSCRVDGLGSDPVFFKLRAVVKVDQTSYMGPYSDAKVGVANFTAPTITGTHSPSATAMTVEWGSVPGATSYRVYRDSAANGAYSTYIGSFTGTSCTDRSAPSGRYSYYKVRAVLSYTGGTLYSNLSAYCSAYPLAVPTMAVANLGGKTARVTWGAVANATAYDVYVSLDGSTYSLLTSATAQERSCDVTFEEDITAGYFKMRAVRQGGSKRFTSNMCGASTVSLTGGSSSVTYRALSIGQLYPGEAQALQGTDLDANSIKAMLETMTATPYAVTRKLNLTASGIVSSIASTFAGADSDDVSLFFYSGHGLFDSNNDYLGALCGVGGLYSTDDIVSPTRLRTALDKIPGTKIVIINACHSGNMIGKGEESSADAFTNSFIQEFSRAGKSNLATNGYYVLVAASKTESGYMLQTNGVWAGVFTRGVCVGSGWNELTSSYTSLYADSNGDRSITLHELYDYSYGYVVSNLSTVGVMQHVQVYPTGSSFVLYGRQ